MPGETVGFWSYVQQDDWGDGNRIRDLADDLREQYRILTGEQLGLFIDKESGWGEAWKERIDNAIAGTTFFIPIITPSYFRSPECRRELLKFAREAERLGLTELLLSVHWVRVPELEDSPEASSDEAVRLVAKYNWEDLREERLEDRESSVYRKAVVKLAENLVERVQRVQDVQDTPGEALAGSRHPGSSGALAEVGSREGEDGIIDRLAATEEAFPQALTLLNRLGERLNEVSDMTERSAGEMRAAAGRGQGAKAALSFSNRLAHELSPPASGIAAIGHEYGKVMGEIDSGIRARLDMVEEREGPLGQDDNEFLEETVGLVTAAHAAAEGLEGMLESMEPVSKLSRSLRTPLGEMKDGLLGILDGNAVMDEWRSQVVGIRESSEPISSA